VSVIFEIGFVWESGKIGARKCEYRGLEEVEVLTRFE